VAVVEQDLVGGGLPAALRTLRDVATRMGAAEAAEQAAEAAWRLDELVLEVAVVGEFKRGKSSLVNALLDRQVLPVGVLPLTAAPTVLERGEPGCEVAFTDGHTERHPLEDLASFVTEAHNPGNRLGVVRVTVRLHAPLLDQGVRLVDTPGVGSVYEHNTQAADAYLPSLDAAVLVTSADPPISKAERAFLGRVAKHAVRLFVVLNKADYLDAVDLPAILAFTERVVREVVPDWPGPLYALSARPGVGDPEALERFRGDLARFLRTERAAVVADAARRTARRILAALQLAVDLERQAATLPAEELARRRRRLVEAADRLRDQAHADGALLEAAVRRGLDALDEVTGQHRPELLRQARQRTVEAAKRHPDLGPGALLDALAAERPRMLAELCQPAVEQGIAAAAAAWLRAVEPITERAAARAQTLQAEAAEAFGVPVQPFTPPDLDIPTPQVSFRTARVIPLASELAPVAWRLLGARAARERAVGRASAEAVDEAGMVLGRLRGATSQQLGEAARQLGARIHRHQTALAGALVAAVERGGTLVAEASQQRAGRLADLDVTAATLREVSASLNLSASASSR
jgi:GTP-binding protein EngB required for normal cell division